MPALTRRRLLQSGLLVAGASVLAACGSDDARAGFVGPDSVRVGEVESRRKPGPVRRFALTAVAGPVDLGGRTVTTWSYDGRLPGAPIRVRAGEQVRVDLTNRLPAPTSVHWHGLALRNNADGVPDVTQPDIRAGARFSYQFTAAQPGTY
jgi:FtsP/CotA-like multicopper oxidase with cupredoxin domain